MSLCRRHLVDTWNDSHYENIADGRTDTSLNNEYSTHAASAVYLTSKTFNTIDCLSVRPCARLAVSLSMFMMMMNFQLQSESMHFYHNQQPKSKSWHEGVILSNLDTLHKLSRSRSIATVHEIRMKLNQMANMFKSTLGFD